MSSKRPDYQCNS